MKKFCTILFALFLFTTAGFAQTNQTDKKPLKSTAEKRFTKKGGSSVQHLKVTKDQLPTLVLKKDDTSDKQSKLTPKKS